MGADAKTRNTAYQDLFKHLVNEAIIAEIRQSVNKGLAIGKESFKEQIETLSGSRLKERKRGRPIG